MKALADSVQAQIEQATQEINKDIEKRKIEKKRDIQIREEREIKEYVKM